MSLLEMILR